MVKAGSITPDVVNRPIELIPVYQRLPSGPAVMAKPTLIPAVWKFETTPAGVIRPIESLPLLVNQRLLSGPRLMPRTPEMPAPVKLLTTPAGVIRPIELFPALVNQMFPSEPAVIPKGTRRRRR